MMTGAREFTNPRQTPKLRVVEQINVAKVSIVPSTNFESQRASTTLVLSQQASHLTAFSMTPRMDVTGVLAASFLA